MSRWTERLVGVVMLVAFTGLPVMATMCEAVCDQPVASKPINEATDASKHEGMAGCHESTPPVGQRITGTSAHDCRTHNDGMRQTEAALTSSRADIGAALLTAAPAFGAVVLTSSSALARSAYSPPLSASLPHAPLVLRV